MEMVDVNEARYLPIPVVLWVEDVTDGEVDPTGWRHDPDMDLLARATRDFELLLDLTGNLDSCV